MVLVARCVARALVGGWCFVVVPSGEEIADTERTYDRAEEKAVRLVVSEMMKIRALLGAEAVRREAEDNALLDSMLYAQQRLQGAVLTSFGADAEGLAKAELEAEHAEAEEKRGGGRRAAEPAPRP